MNLYEYVGNDPVNKWDPTGFIDPRAAKFQIFIDVLWDAPSTYQDQVFNRGISFGGTGAERSMENLIAEANQVAAEKESSEEGLRHFQETTKPAVIVAQFTPAGDLKDVMSVAHGDYFDEVGLLIGVLPGPNLKRLKNSVDEVPGVVKKAEKAGETAIEESVKEGRYEFPDQAADGTPYVGQSGDVPSRLNKHEKAGRLERGTL